MIDELRFERLAVLYYKSKFPHDWLLLRFSPFNSCNISCELDSTQMIFRRDTKSNSDLLMRLKKKSYVYGLCRNSTNSRISVCRGLIASISTTKETHVGHFSRETDSNYVWNSCVFIMRIVSNIQCQSSCLLERSLRNSLRVFPVCELLRSCVYEIERDGVQLWWRLTWEILYSAARIFSTFSHWTVRIALYTRENPFWGRQ